ncbi:MAG: poly-beta-1,6-N-acetyl-D-glucosamine biosynthesis protein PgaD [Methylococcus sp.]|nr:poly-beta-1,6-N-acetyl-D-glucosamine biosynthesis protein PgaD [Methylococcus sp.]
MTELVINAPELQTQGQRLSAFAVTVMGWLLWAYFLFPVLELCGLWLDIRLCSVWVNLSGGYLGLTQLLQLYAATVIGLAALWTLRVAYGLSGPVASDAGRPMPSAVGNEALCAAFQVDVASLIEGRNSRACGRSFRRPGADYAVEGAKPETGF